MIDNNNLEHSLFAFLGKTMQTVRILLEQCFNENNVDINLTQYVMLHVIYSRDDMILEELSKIMNKDKSAILRHLNHLNKRFFVAKMVDNNDMRKKVLMLTKKGVEELNKAKKIEVTMIQKITDKLDKNEIEALQLALSTVNVQAMNLLIKKSI